MYLKQLKVKIGTDLREFDRGLQTVNARLDTLQRDIQRRYGALSGALGDAGRTLTIGLTAPLLLAGGAAVQAALRFDQLKRGLATVAGGAAQAEAQLQQLAEVAKLPGLGYQEAIQFAVSVQAIGESFEFAKEMALRWGNALATTGGGKEQFGHVQAQLTQMLSKNKVLMEDVRILMNYMPQLGKAMKAAYGTASPEAIQEMGVDARTFVADINKQFASLPRMTTGWMVELDNASDELQRSLADLGKEVAPTLVALAKEGTRLLEAFNNLSPTTKRWVVDILALSAALGPALVATSALVNVSGALAGGFRMLAAKRAASAAAAAAANAVDATTLQISPKILAALGAETTAVEAATAAQAGLLAKSKAFVAANGLVFAFAAATAAAIVLEETIRRVTAAAEKAAQKTQKLPGWVQRENAEQFTREIAGRTDAQLKVQQKNLQARIKEQEKLKEEAEKAAGWKLGFDWKTAAAAGGITGIPAGLYAGSAPDLRAVADVAAHKAEIERLAAQEAAIAQRLKDAPGGRQAGLSKEAKDAKRKNEEANTEARAELKALMASTETEREIAEAEAERAKALAAVKEAARKAKEEHKLKLDTKDQEALIQAKYKQRVTEAREAAEAINTESRALLAAANTENEYERERLRIDAELTRTLADLHRRKAEAIQFRLAEAESDRQLRDLARREAEQAAEDSLAASTAASLQTRNQRVREIVAATVALVATYTELARRERQGEQVAGAWALAQAQFHDKMREIRIAQERERAEDSAAGQMAAAIRIRNKRHIDEMRAQLEYERQIRDLNERAAKGEQVGGQRRLVEAEYAERGRQMRLDWYAQDVDVYKQRVAAITGAAVAEMEAGGNVAGAALAGLYQAYTSELQDLAVAKANATREDERALIVERERLLIARTRAGLEKVAEEEMKRRLVEWREVQQANAEAAAVPHQVAAMLAGMANQPGLAAWQTMQASMIQADAALEIRRKELAVESALAKTEAQREAARAKADAAELQGWATKVSAVQQYHQALQASVRFTDLNAAREEAVIGAVKAQLPSAWGFLPPPPQRGLTDAAFTAGIEGMRRDLFAGNMRAQQLFDLVQQLAYGSGQ